MCDVILGSSPQLMPCPIKYSSILDLEGQEKRKTATTFVASPVSSPISLFSVFFAVTWWEIISLKMELKLHNQDYNGKELLGNLSRSCLVFFFVVTSNSWKIRNKRVRDHDWKMSTWENWAFVFHKKKNPQMIGRENYRWSFSEEEKLYLEKNRAESERGAYISCVCLKKEGMKQKTWVDGKWSTSKWWRANRWALLEMGKSCMLFPFNIDHVSLEINFAFSL